MELSQIKLHQKVSGEDMIPLFQAENQYPPLVFPLDNGKLCGNFIEIKGYLFKAIYTEWQCQGTPEGDLNTYVSPFSNAVSTPTQKSSPNFYKRYKSHKGGVENE